MRRYITALSIAAFIVTGCSTSQNKSTEAEVKEYKTIEEYIVFSINKEIPRAQINSTLTGKDIGEIKTRGEAELKKPYILPGCKRVILINITNNVSTMYDPVHKKSIPLSAQVELYEYADSKSAEANYDHMMKTPHWIEKGHGEVINYINNYSYRTISLGPDQLLVDLHKIVMTSINEYTSYSK